MANSFLGTGMKFPPQIDPTTGRFATVSEEESVKESIYLILMTQQSERLARPGFGSNLLSHTFMDMGTTSLSMLKYGLADLIRSQEPRVGSVTITTENSEGQGVLFINIEYTIRESNTVDNLVFPFYLNAEPEEPEEEPEFYEPQIIENV